VVVDPAVLGTNSSASPSSPSPTSPVRGTFSSPGWNSPVPDLPPPPATSTTSPRRMFSSSGWKTPLLPLVPDLPPPPKSVYANQSKDMNLKKHGRIEHFP